MFAATAHPSHFHDIGRRLSLAFLSARVTFPSDKEETDVNSDGSALVNRLQFVGRGAKSQPSETRFHSPLKRLLAMAPHGAIGRPSLVR